MTVVQREEPGSASASFSSSLWVQLILSLHFNCHNCFMFATQPLLCLFVSPTRSRSPCFSEGSDASNEEGAGVRRGTTKKHRKWEIWMKLPLILKPSVQTHILFCSVVVGLGRYYAALSNAADVTVIPRCCLNIYTMEGKPRQLTFGFYF